MQQKVYYVCMLTNTLKTVLYTGMTNGLLQRITGHYKYRGQQTSFTSKYNVYYLFRFESHPCINNAIAREKKIKGWRRERKN